MTALAVCIVIAAVLFLLIEGFKAAAKNFISTAHCKCKTCGEVFALKGGAGLPSPAALHTQLTGHKEYSVSR